MRLCVARTTMFQSLEESKGKWGNGRESVSMNVSKNMHNFCQFLLQPIPLCSYSIMDKI